MHSSGFKAPPYWLDASCILKQVIILHKMHYFGIKFSKKISFSSPCPSFSLFQNSGSTIGHVQLLVTWLRSIERHRRTRNTQNMQRDHSSGKPGKVREFQSRKLDHTVFSHFLQATLACHSAAVAVAAKIHFMMNPESAGTTWSVFLTWSNHCWLQVKQYIDESLPSYWKSRGISCSGKWSP